MFGSFTTRQLIAEALLSGLAFAQRTRDTGRIKLLMELLARDRREQRWEYAKIVRAASPLKFEVTPGRVSVKFERPESRIFDLAQAANSLKLLREHDKPLACENWSTKEFNTRLKTLQFYLGLHNALEFNRALSMPGFQDWLRHITSIHPSDLLLVFWSCAPLAIGVDSDRTVFAAEAIARIEKEWRRRTAASDYFAWPQSYLQIGSGALEDGIDSPVQGIFSALGYRVGKIQGQPREVRQFILDYIFSRDLPPLNGPSYMKKWRQPGTPGRLRAMAYFLARTSWIAQRRKAQNLSLAISQWTEDLEYLRARYCQGRFGWGWPSS